MQSSNLRISFHHGTLSIKGEEVEKVAAKWKEVLQLPKEMLEPRQLRDGELAHHITLLTSSEMQSLSPQFCGEMESLGSTHIDDIDIVDLGIGKFSSASNIVVYAILFIPWGNQLRSRLGLAPKDFHITLGFSVSDVYDISKGLDTISTWSNLELLAQRFGNSSFIDRIFQFSSCYDQIIEITQHLVYNFLMIPRVWDEESQTTTLKAICAWSMKKLIQSVYLSDIAFFLLDRGVLFGLKVLCYLSVRHQVPISESQIKSKFPLLVTDRLKDSYQELKLFRILNVWLSPAVSKHAMAVSLDCTNNVVDLNSLPRNFSWVSLAIDESFRTSTNVGRVQYLCGSAIPSNTAHILSLRGVGVRSILTIHENQLPVDLRRFIEEQGMRSFHFAVEDRTPPTIPQLEDMCNIIHEEVKRGHGVLVHCQGGVGRTNTVIVAYLVWSQRMSASDAIAQVTNERKVLLTVSQEKLLREWWSHVVNDLRSEFEDSAPVTVGDTTGNAPKKIVEIPLSLDLPPLLLMCGYAASGKSTFSKALTSANPEVFTRVNKDEMRGKGQIEDVFTRSLRKVSSGRRGSGCIVVDCCNLTVQKRKEWLDMAHKGRAWCIFFDFHVEDCKTRIRHRQGHPTIPPGEAGIKVLRSMERQLVPPTAEEGFERVIVIQSHHDVCQLLSDWGISSDYLQFQSCVEAEVTHLDGLLKFPRTPHAFNLGSATRDDKIVSQAELSVLFGADNMVFIEEKLDGANMGLFINSSGRIIAQNRSHFISSSYHPQFALLDKWIARHTEQLWQIMEPGRHILYGEWLYATHSVYYNKLPGWFIAYDLFDRETNSFLSRPDFDVVMSTVSIPRAPTLFVGKVSGMDELLGLISGPSQFNDDRREGIVIRVCDSTGKKMLGRSKIVRSDFIAGNERWNRSAVLQVNALAPFES